MNLYNTLTKKQEKFIPNEEGVVRLYTCGPTVYNYAHIGNLRTYIFEDVLEKGLTYLGYDVKRVMNITDVGHLTSDADTGEDKMEKGAKQAGMSVLELAKFYTDAFLHDMELLNIKKPAVISRASDNISMYIKMISKMIDDGYAYVSSGNVYFDVSKCPNYYELSLMTQEDMIVGARDDVSLDIHKKNPADFVLWFTVSKFQNHIMKWDSPWGVGYPGWHIECSGIAIKYLGERLDIHCGGVDNIFPHHSNEIAQSEAYLGHKWCNFWCHGAHLNDKSGKMSKSKGGILTVSKLEEEGYSPLVYRYFCLNSHYRKELTYSKESMDIAKKSFMKLKNKVLKLSREGEVSFEDFQFYRQKFIDAFADDINTSLMLTVVYDVLKSSLNDATKYQLISSFDQVLSLDLFQEEVSSLSSEFQEEIRDAIRLREDAKKNKNYQLADKIRDEMLKKGVKLIDTREGTLYEIVSI